MSVETELPPAAGARNEALDALKGLAIVGVVLVHMNFTSRLSQESLRWIAVVQQFFGWCVVAFFFGAGVLTRMEEDQPGGWMQFVFKRARRLLVPCLAFSVTYKVCLVTLNRFAGFGPPVPLPGLDALGWVEFLLMPVGPQFYFLPYLFIISTLSVIAAALARGTIVLCWIVLLGYLSFSLRSPAPLVTHGSSPELIPSYAFSFWLGFMARTTWRAHRAWWGMVFLCVLWGSISRATFSYLHVVLPVLLYWSFRKVRLNRSVIFLGLKSGSIYVWHDPLLLPACSIAAARMFQNEGLQVAMILCLGIGISILMGEAVRRAPYLSCYRF